MSNQVNQNYEYHVWANNRVFRRLGELPQDVLHQEMANVFPTLYAGLVHIYIVDTVWLLALKGNTYEQIMSLIAGQIEKTSGKSLEQLEALYAELTEEYREFLTSGADLHTVRDYPHPMYGVLHANTEELITHVVNHGTYHRGNLTSMLRQLGYAGASSDYVLYLYDLNAKNKG